MLSGIVIQLNLGMFPRSLADSVLAVVRVVCIQLDTNSRLADRVDQIRVLKDLLERTAAALEQEISNLNETKQNLEYALDQRVGLAVHVNVENLVSREGRRNGDIVEDVVEVEVHKVDSHNSRLHCYQFLLSLMILFPTCLSVFSNSRFYIFIVYLLRPLVHVK